MYKTKSNALKIREENIVKLDFSIDGYENLFRQALANGINLFCGAGFSVEAKDKRGNNLPVGEELLKELKDEFPSIVSYSKLSRACTKLKQTDKQSFYNFLNNRFTVSDFSESYCSLLKINIKNIYTTNIDDLFFEIFNKSANEKYLNDKSTRGTIFEAELSGSSKYVNYFPLHGCVRTTEDYVFGETEIASAFSQKNVKKSWESLARDAEENAILFWGWNFEDAGPIEAMYGGQHNIDNNVKKWVLLYERNEETIDYLQTLNFNIILGDTNAMLQYLCDFVSQSFDKREEFIGGDKNLEEKMKKYCPPQNDNHLVSYPLSSFFVDYTPRWSYIYSGAIPKLKYFKQIADFAAAGKNVIITGIRGSGKTTLLMQLVVMLETKMAKHYMVSPSLEEVQVYCKELSGSQSILFIDDCFRDTEALLYLLNEKNVQIICCDRDFNFERQFHKIKKMNFEAVDITALSDEDAQEILNIIPREIKKDEASTKKFKEDPILPNLLAVNLRASNFKFMSNFYDKDPDAARVFLMICYVHSCGVPCSFDMVYSFLGDDFYSWSDMLEIVKHVGGLIKEYNASFNYFGSYDIEYALQDYYECRSRFFAEKIISSIPKGNEVFASILMNFIENVPAYKICSYDKFKRAGYDADLACRAFVNVDDGKKYYKSCIQSDESEYTYQQAAIYFSRNGEFKEAFAWIDKARNLSHYNRFSIDSTYAQIYFEANKDIDGSECRRALEILNNCCTSDKRKSIHFLAFANCALQYGLKYSQEDAQGAYNYICKAINYVDEGLADSNLSLRTSHKWQLINIRKKLVESEKEYERLIGQL